MANGVIRFDSSKARASERAIQNKCLEIERISRKLSGLNAIWWVGNSKKSFDKQLKELNSDLSDYLKDLKGMYGKLGDVIKIMDEEEKAVKKELEAGVVAAWHTGGEYTDGNFSAKGNLYAGKAWADAGVNFFEFSRETWSSKKPDSENPEDTGFFGVGVNASAGVSGVSADGSVYYGNDTLGAGVGGQGDLLTANAEAGIRIGGDYSDGKWGVAAIVEGSAMVAAAQGSAKADINFFGLTISGTATGYAGAAGIEGEVGVRNGQFTIGGGAAFGVGGRLDVSIGFNPEGFTETIDTIGNVASNVGSAIGNTASNVGDAIGNVASNVDDTIGSVASEVGKTIADRWSFW